MFKSSLGRKCPSLLKIVSLTLPRRICFFLSFFFAINLFDLWSALAQALKVMIENVEMEKRRIPPSLPCLEAKILSKHKIASCHLCRVQLFFFFFGAISMVLIAGLWFRV